MQFLLVLAIIVAVSISEYAPHEPVPNMGWRLGLAVFAMAVVPLFAAATSTLIAGSLRRDAGRKSEMLRWFGRLRGVHSVLWLLVAGAVLQELGWVRLVRFNWHLDGVFLVDDVLILLPIVLPLVLSWAAFYEVERGLHLAEVAEGYSASTPVSRGQYLSLHIRHYLGLLLIPVLAVLAVQDVVRWIGPLIPGDAEAWLLLLPCGLLLVFFPVVLRRLWKTEPLGFGPLRDQLLNFSRRVDFEPGEFLIWKTDRMIVNAAVAGLIRPLRYVFFTDTLLARFNDSEVEAVLGHEIGHVRRHHLFERVLLMALPVVLWFAFAKAFPLNVETLSAWLAGFGFNPAAQAALCGPLGLALFAITVFAWHARLLEHEADLFACRACDSEQQLRPAGIELMAGVLEKLARVSGMGRKSRSWLHPTIATRVDFLDRVSADPRIGERFELRRWLVARAMCAVLLAAALYLAWPA